MRFSLAHHHPRSWLAGFTLPELLVVIVILGVIGSVGIQGFFFLVRRARVQSVALEVAGWLEQVRNAAADEVFPRQGCQITFATGTLAGGVQLAAVDQTGGACPFPEPVLRVPPGVQLDTVQIAVAGTNPLVFTPRGLWIAPGGAIGQNFLLSMTLTGGGPLRCIRLTPTLGSVEIGRPPNSAGDTCTNWQTL